MIEISYTLRIDGIERQVEQAWLGENLLYVLRERLGFPGAKSACEQGECGSCSVLLDGRVVCACLVLAANAGGRRHYDARRSSTGGSRPIQPIQQAFVEEGAVQCGFCTPGLVVAVTKLLEDHSDPSDLEIREAISGNLCRCTGYGRILAAVHAAVGATRA